MKYKCDKCDRPATHHAVEIIKGEKFEKHLCEEHAAEEGLALNSAHTPINELLTNFVKMTGAKGAGKAASGMIRVNRTCPDCGLKFSDFREKSVLGCAGCYKAFKRALVTLLERAHEGGSQHVGKVPRRSGGGEQRQLLIARMRKRLDTAIAAENYELAAQLRDDITGMEHSGKSTTAKQAPSSQAPAPQPPAQPGPPPQEEGSA